MEQEEELAFLRDLNSGELAFRDAFGLSESTLEEVARTAAASFIAQRYEDACRLFSWLELVEPDRPLHSLHRAAAEGELDQIPDALESLKRFFERSGDASPVDVVSALLMRARYVVASDPDAAREDISRAIAIGIDNPEAQRLLQGVLS